MVRKTELKSRSISF